MGEVTTLLRELAAKLGTTVEHLWAVLIRQAYIEGVKAIVLFILAIPLSFIWFRFFRKRDKDDEEYAGPNVVWIISGMFMLIFLIGSSINLIYSIDNFFNPEYWALQKILRQIR